MREHLITTQARAVACPRCRRVVLAGIAEGLNAIVDLTPIKPGADEMATLLANRRTYTFLAGELVYRDPPRIRGQSRGLILAEHKCVSRKPIQHSLFDSESPGAPQ